jgi:hypothetical protein
MPLDFDHNTANKKNNVPMPNPPPPPPPPPKNIILFSVGSFEIVRGFEFYIYLQIQSFLKKKIS